MNAFLRTSAPVLLIAGSTAADSYWSFLNLPQAGLAEEILLFSGLTVGFGLLISAGVIGIRRQKRRERKAATVRFSVNCKRFDFDEPEEQKMHQMARGLASGDPNVIFDSPQTFEQCVDREVNRVIGASPPEEHQAYEDLLGSIRAKLHYRTVEEGAPLVSTRNIPTGQRVSLVMYHCEAVMGVNREFHFTLKIDKKEQIPMVPAGAPLRMVFARKNDALYGAEVVAISSDPAGYIRCRHTISLKRNQLRRDVRLGVNSAIKLRLYRPADPSQPFDTGTFPAKLVDISGGGLSFISDKQLAVSDMVYLISAGPQIPAAGILIKILATSTPPSKDQGKRYHAQFINIGFDKKEKIIRYIFEKMREFNKR